MRAAICALMELLVMTPRLTRADIDALLAQPTEDVRAEIAVKVGGQVAAGELSGQERLIANDILRIMVRDVADRVRVALTRSIAQTRDIPGDVAAQLARDIDEIAVPFLAVSPALSDDDLVAIVRMGSDAKSTAIAGRAVVSDVVCGALASAAGKGPVTRMLSNRGADIAPAAFHTVIDRWPQDDDVTGAMAQREVLPLSIAERLVTLVSDEVKQHLMAHHALGAEMAERLALEAREAATIGLLDGLPDVENFERLMDHLHVSGRLTGTLIVRAACMGEMRFVEYALAKLAHISAGRAWKLVHDAGRLGLRALFQRTGLAEALYPPLRTAVDVFHETALNGEVHDQEHFRRTLIERVLTQTDGLEGDDLDFLLYQISRQEQKMAQPQAISA